MADDLFAAEEAVIEAAEKRVDEGRFSGDDDREAFDALLKSYKKLFRQTRRLVRISDRNEHELNLMADKQRLAAEEIVQKHKELETLSTKLAKYLSPQVYASIFAGTQEVKLESQRKKLTVFFSDIEDFTETTDRLESEELTHLLNQYLSAMSEVALKYGATIDKYVGDAIMIFFGDPETRGVKEDALACVKMAIAMQERMGELSHLWRDAGIARPLSCRIGINTGYCTVGNFGSDDRMDYTIIGGAVNLASRLEHEAEAGGVLISYETYAHVKEEVVCEEAGEVQVKGIAYKVQAYRVLGLRGDLAQSPQEIVEDFPHFKLTAAPANMSAKEKETVIAALERTMAHFKGVTAIQDSKRKVRELPSGRRGKRSENRTKSAR